ncbi:hypothetical protein A3Q56_05583 [Intoshia linei]|uniref:Uncharacterized protein n=1 Tax=Intoshia linei TaxID=1819745 RepID=A0A177AZ93_9BILA|nr:hypothetical protein A3Q56_05583 [Intoshia linei]
MDKEKLQYFLEQVSRLKINLKTNNYTKNTAASIYNLLPAFCEIYSNYTHELITTFPQILLFCNFCLKNGDKLLESICILSKADTNMIDAMSRFRLATQMVRCLKIFINVDNTTYIDIPCAEKTYKSFSDILRRICHHQSTVNELLLSLAMKSLFDCFLIKKQDPRWREIAFDSILPILQNYMDSKLIDFISKNNVISHYLNQIVTLAEINEKSENIYIAAENLINLIVYMLNSSVQVDYAIITEFNSKFGYEIFISFIKR